MSGAANAGAPLPSSPTNSSLSSSDLDTESTGSFFHDRSTSLGNLMGVTVQAITFRASNYSSQHPPDHQNPPISVGGRRNRQRRRWWWWWRLCREESDARRASLGQYLEVERNAAAAELEQGVLRDVPTITNGRSLFADGRVLPPAEESSPAAASGICRFSAGLCRFGSVVL